VEEPGDFERMKKIRIFGEKTVKVFFKKIAEMLKEKSENTIDGTFPTCNFIHGFGGQKDTDLYFTTIMLLTTNKELIDVFNSEIQSFIKTNQVKFQLKL